MEFLLRSGDPHTNTLTLLCPPLGQSSPLHHLDVVGRREVHLATFTTIPFQTQDPGPSSSSGPGAVGGRVMRALRGECTCISDEIGNPLIRSGLNCQFPTGAPLSLRL